jgi:hypothetical protein
VLAEPVSELLAVDCDDLDGHVAWIGEDQNDLLRHLPTWFGAASEGAGGVHDRPV